MEQIGKPNTLVAHCVVEFPTSSVSFKLSAVYTVQLIWIKAAESLVCAWISTQRILFGWKASVEVS